MDSTPADFPPAAACARETALSFAGVSHAYGRHRVVDDVALSVRRGEIVCLVGPSGCGKSTLLRLAAGLEDLQAGTIAIAGRTVADRRRADPPERRGAGLVFQDFALFPHLTVLDNVRFGLAGRSGEVRRRRALEALAQVGMDAFAAAYPHTLSGGQQQRVALARALAPEPPVLLLDEPFSGLDARLRHKVRDDTLHVLKHSSAATLLVTHDPEEALFLADRVALMREGRLEQVGAPVDLYCRPATAFAARFFGEVNRLSGTVRDGAVATPFGPIAAGGLAEGTVAEVLIRPEGLALTEPEAGGEPGGEAAPVAATVEAARLLGRTTLVHLALRCETGRGETGRGEENRGEEDRERVHLHAQIPGPSLPDEGARVGLVLDRRQAFVFPASAPI
jgi:iron(III) transport system ATP-binding protein